MRNKIIYVDFSKNKRKNNKLTFLSGIKSFIKGLLGYNNSSTNNNSKKVIHYNRDIS